MKVKTFVLGEANRLLLRINEIFDDIYLIKKKIALMKGEADWLKEFWKQNLYDADNPDAERYDKIVDRIEKLYVEIVKKVDGAQRLGCIVRDVDLGLVDFYSIVNGELSFLCWKYGEKEIRYWHTIESGFRGRKPIRSIDKIEQ